MAGVQIPVSMPYVGWFVVGSFLCSERFLSIHSSFSLSSRTNISKSHFDAVRASGKETQRGSSTLNTTRHYAPNSGHIK